MLGALPIQCPNLASLTLELAPQEYVPTTAYGKVYSADLGLRPVSRWNLSDLTLGGGGWSEGAFLHLAASLSCTARSVRWGLGDQIIDDAVGGEVMCAAQMSSIRGVQRLEVHSAHTVENVLEVLPLTGSLQTLCVMNACRAGAIAGLLGKVLALKTGADKRGACLARMHLHFVDACDLTDGASIDGFFGLMKRVQDTEVDIVLTGLHCTFFPSYLPTITYWHGVKFAELRRLRISPATEQFDTTSVGALKKSAPLIEGEATGSFSPLGRRTPYDTSALFRCSQKSKCFILCATD